MIYRLDWIIPLLQDSVGVYYAIFDLPSAQIQVLCHSSDERLPAVLQTHYDLFRGSSEEPRGQYISTISNCPFQLQGITNFSEALMNSTAGQQTVNSLCPSMVSHWHDMIYGNAIYHWIDCGFSSTLPKMINIVSLSALFLSLLLFLPLSGRARRSPNSWSDLRRSAHSASQQAYGHASCLSPVAQPIAVLRLTPLSLRRAMHFTGRENQAVYR